MMRVGNVGIGLLTIALGCLAGSVGAAGEPSRHILSYRNDHLSVRLAAVPLEDVVAEIGQACGAQVSGTVRKPRDVSAEFDDVPLQDALHRLLGEQNFVLKYGKGDRLRTIKLLGGPHVPVATVATSEQAATAPSVAVFRGPPQDIDGAIAMLNEQPPVPVSGELAEALGTDKATLRQLFDAASSNDSSAVRAEAMHTFVGAMDADPDFRNRALGALNALDDATVTELLRGLAGDHAEEIVAQLAASAHLHEMSSRAFGIYLMLGGTRSTTSGTDSRPAS